MCYEQRLLALSNGSTCPDISGQAFTISDPGPPRTYGDAYTVLETLDGETFFPRLSPTVMLLVAHIVEIVYLTRYFLDSSSRLLRSLSYIVPEVKGDMINLQPSLFNLTQVHLIFDDSRARLPAEMGGLGYRGAYTTLEGLCKTVAEHKRLDGRGEDRSISGGISFSWRHSQTENAAGKATERLAAMQILN